MDSISIPAGLLFQEALTQHFLASCALFIALLLAWTIACGKILKLLFSIPTIAGNIIGGVLLGPSCINIAQIPFFAQSVVMVSQSDSVVYSLPSSDLFITMIIMISAIFTVPYLLWMAGHETDLYEMMHVGWVAALGGICGAVLPVVGVVLVLECFFALQWTLVQSVALGLAFAATSVSIPVAMLFAAQKMHLKSSRATLGAAVIDDIIAVLFLSLFMILLDTGFFGNGAAVAVHTSPGNLWGALGSIFGVLASLIAVGYFCIPSLLRSLDRLQLSHIIIPLATICMLLSFSFVELVGGLAGITGAYFAGLFHRMGDVHHQALEAVSPFVTALLLPLFLGSIGFQIDVRILNCSDWFLVIILLVVAIITKLCGCWIATNLVWLFSGAKQSWSSVETYLFGASMVARGEVGLVVSTIVYNAHIITQQQYVISVVVIVLTTIAAPVLLAIGFMYQEKYDVQKESDSYAKIIIAKALVPTLGVNHLLYMLIETVQSEGIANTMVYVDEGKEVVTLEGQGVKIMVCPDEGLVFEGNKATIKRVIELVRKKIAQDIGNLSSK